MRKCKPKINPLHHILNKHRICLDKKKTLLEKEQKASLLHYYGSLGFVIISPKLADAHTHAYTQGKGGSSRFPPFISTTPLILLHTSPWSSASPPTHNVSSYTYNKPKTYVLNIYANGGKSQGEAVQSQWSQSLLCVVSSCLSVCMHAHTHFMFILFCSFAVIRRSVCNRKTGDYLSTGISCVSPQEPHIS